MPKDTIDLPILGRAANVRAESVNEEERTVELVWTTGAKVRRYSWEDGRIEEELVVAPGSIRLERLNGGAPFLNSHNAYRLDAILGVVVEGSARIEGGKGYATIRFSERDDVEPIWRDIKAGIIRNISVGYRVHKFEIEKREGQIPLYRAVDWEPLEISAVAIGADPGASVRSDDQGGDARTFPCVLIRQDDPAATPAATAKRSDMSEKNKAAAGGNAGNANPDGEAAQTRAADSTVETRAANPAAPPAQSTPSTGPDADAIRAEERKRSADILALVKRHGLGDDFAAEQVARDVSIDEVRAAILDKLAATDDQGGRRAEPSVGFARGGLDADISYRDGLTEALMHRHNPEATPLSEKGREFRGMSLIELARDALERQGTRTRGMSKMEIAGAAMAQRSGTGYHGTSDFPAILANVANKTLRQAYESTPRTFTAWARRATITDFKQVQRTQLGGAPDLKKVLENGEFTYGTIGEGAEVYALATYGRIVSITRQAIINDDLDAFTRVPAAFGSAAADLESDIVYMILTDNPLMGDGTALFDASRENIGTASVIDEDALAEAWRLFGQKKGIEDRLISIQPRFLITAPGRRYVEARKQVTATTPANTQDVNAFAGQLEIIAEPRLINGTDPDPWFLAADPSRIDTIEYAYLEGQEGIYTETRMGFEVDGIEIKARHDFASKAIDWRGLLKNAGAAPTPPG